MIVRFKYWSHCGPGILPIKYVFRIVRSPKRVVQKMWREDFRCSECKFNYSTPECFTTSFWQKTLFVQPLWITYRFFIALYFVITWFLAFIHVGRDVKAEDKNKFFIFLTNWTYTIETIQFTMAFIIVVIGYMRQKRNNFDPEVIMDSMPWYYKAYWVLYTISIPASVCVTCIFWTAIYDPENGEIDFINISTHACNCIFAIIDFFLVGHPFRLMHIYLPNLYAITYLIFSLIYQLSGGTGTEGKIPIYGILDWDRPGQTALVCFLCQSFLMAIHVLFWLLHKAKEAIKKKNSCDIEVKKQKEGIENLGMDIRIV